MTVRQGQASGSAVLAKPLTNGSSVSKDRSSTFSWDEWFSHASPQQRASALGLAQQQGLLYPSQLPAISNGVHPTTVVKETDLSLLLPGLLSGKADALPRLNLEPLTYFDAALDDLQQQAVVRAIKTPDFFLLHGLPGTGKSRVLAEIILQAAARGQRVLFLAAHVASLDVVLERLVGKPEIFALRHLDSAEKPESLPAWLRRFTFEEQKQSFVASVLAGARGNHEKAIAACRRHSDLESAWPELRTCVERSEELRERLSHVQGQIDGLREVVEREANIKGQPIAAKLLDRLQPSLDSINALQTELAQRRHSLGECEAKAASLATRIAMLEPAYRAKKGGRFWTPTFWSGLFNGSIIHEMETLLEQKTAADAERQTMGEQIKQGELQRQLQHDAFAQAQQALIDQEIDARRLALLKQQQSLAEEHRQLDEQWIALCRRLEIAPTTRTTDAIGVAHQAWLDAKGPIEQQCQFAQQWTAFVEQAGPQLMARLPSFANLLALTLSRWQADAKVREAGETPVDLLIIEDAETLTEADLLKLAGHAHRCVLTSSALAETIPAPPTGEKAPRPALVTAGCWNRLLHAFEGDADQWPHTWRRDQGRLCCQLMPLSTADLQHLESECLVDAADIELGILHCPRTRPCLAQVLFPPQHQFAEAFTFMVREVQEFPLEPLGRTGWLSEDAGRLCWRMGPPHADDAPWLTIEAGLRLGIAACAVGQELTKVACIEFDKGLGWDRTKAEDWLSRHRRGRDFERRVFLQTPYRFDRRLASVVQTVVRASDWLTAALAESASGPSGLEFVAVPALAKHDWPREGAGLELDLSASRQGDRLPAGLRPGLPARGVVNYLEAQALVRRVETWMQKESAGAGVRVGLLALYASQVELLRRLVEQSEILRARTFALEIALPSRLHQWECNVAFLSLMRSHAHRCVAFGEDARELPLALTRARTRLFVFGDPGSLCKRASWRGPLDHLDARSAHQEQVHLARLLAHVQHHAPALVNGSANGK
jgi:hypothetical protein